MTNISAYEAQALNSIQIWKNQKTSQTKLGQKVRKSVKQIRETTLISSVENLGSEKLQPLNMTISKATQGIINILNDGACWSVRSDAIYSGFRKKGYDFIHSGTDINQLNLDQIDHIVGFLDAKYKVVAVGEGLVTGASGLPGLLADIPILITLNLRAIGTYCTYYGFNLQLQPERAFALHVLLYASSSTDAQKQIVLANLTKIAGEIAKKKTWEELEKHLFVKGTQKIAQALGIRLTKAKLGQFVPLAGAAIGGAYNAYYTSKVTEAAYYLYRERFLIEKYGTHIVTELHKDD